MAPVKKPQLAQSETVDSLPLACVDENAARALIERDRWGDHPHCPHCGDTDVYRMTGAAATKRGLWRCHGCKKQYTVRVASIFEDSKIPLTMWCRAMWEATSCKNGVSALELSRKLQITYKSALFMMQRLRMAMAKNPKDPQPLMDGPVEIDETRVGGKPRHTYSSQPGDPSPNYKSRFKRHAIVVAVVERGGDVRARVIPSVSSANLRKMLDENVRHGAIIHTDEFRGYRSATRLNDDHRTVNHSLREYVDMSDRTNHTNTIEGFFSRVKRGINGTYHAVSKKHLHRYVSQFAFAYNTRGLNDGERFTKLVSQTGGKRLMYRRPPARGAA